MPIHNLKPKGASRISAGDTLTGALGESPSRAARLGAAKPANHNAKADDPPLRGQIREAVARSGYTAAWMTARNRDKRRRGRDTEL
jgi:hypothetical protein